MGAADTGAVVDAFTAEVIRASLISITTEMKTNLMRTAYNPIIYEGEDFTVGLFDGDGNTLSIGLGLPMFIRGLSDCIKAKIEFWGRENIEPGDILLTNDPEVMGSHLNHLIFTLPVFHDGELVAFSSSMAHWADVGGVLGGITQDIYSEGIQIPFVKVFKAGKEDYEISSIIRMNCRAPERAMGDMRAQIAAIRTGERRLVELLRRYGNAAFHESAEMIFTQSERRAHAEVELIPDGVYEADAFMDDDGVVIGKHIVVAVRVEVSGDQMTIDLSGCSAQVAGFFNVGSTAGRSAAEVAFKFLTTPTLYPINDGALRALNIILPPGRIISATKPSAMRKWMTVPMTVVDTIFKALAPACPERVMAGHHADLGVARAFGFIDPATGVLSARNGGGGGGGGGFGATSDGDGMSATICLNDGDTHNSPVEAGEAKAPIVVIQRALRIDSGGPGRFRGGLGVIQEQQTLVPAMFQAQVERTQCAPWGLLGGKEALANRVGIVRNSGEIERFASGKVSPCRLEANDRWLTEMGGGGGFGDPLMRDPERVLTDVRAGYVSIESACDDYGVIVQLNKRSFDLDHVATGELRERLAESREQNMKIVLYGDDRRLGALEGNRVIDLHRAYSASLREVGNSNPESVTVERFGVGLAGFIANGSLALDAAEDAIGHVMNNGAEGGIAEQIDAVKLHAPWPGGRIACVGGNYAEHSAGMRGDTTPEENVKRARSDGQWGFWKVSADVVGPGDDVSYPKRTEYLDYEGEVAIILGKRGKNIPADRIDEYVWGITLFDDISIRDNVVHPLRGVSYNFSKNFDGAAAMGPAIVVREHLDPQNIDLETRVNGQIRQHYNSSAMVFSFGEVLEFLSVDFTFVPGDVISGGTGSGTAADKTPRATEGRSRPKDLFLNVGDAIEVSSPQIGAFTNRIV